MALSTIRTKEQLATAAARAGVIWLRMTSRKNLVSKRISRRDQANTEDRARLVRLTSRDSRLFERHAARVAEYVLRTSEPGQGASLDVETCTIKRYVASQGSLTFAVDEDTTVEELRLLVAAGSITEAEFRTVTKTTIRKDPLKASDLIMGLLSTASADRGDFMSLAFPTMSEKFGRPMAFWRRLVSEHFGESPST